MTTGTFSIIVGVVLLILLKTFFKGGDGSVADKGEGEEQDDLFKEEPELDPSWSLLPGNVWSSDDD